MGVPAKPPSDAGRGKILSAALLALALLTSLVAFSPLADADDDNGEDQPTYITVAWKLPANYADGKETREPSGDWDSIWVGGQAFIAKATTANTWNLDALDNNGAVQAVLNECGALQVDVYNYTTQEEKAAVDNLWADGFLTKNGTPEDSGLHPVSGLGNGWKFLWNTDSKCDDPGDEPDPSWEISVRKYWSFWVGGEDGYHSEDVPAGSAEIVVTVDGSDNVFLFDTDGTLISINGNTDHDGYISGEGEIDLWGEDVSYSERNVNVPGWSCEIDAMEVMSSGVNVSSRTLYLGNDCEEDETPPEESTTTTTPPEEPSTTTTTPEEPSTTSTTEEVGGEDVEKPTTTVEKSTTTDPEVKGTEATPGAKKLPRTGSNTGAVMSIAGVLLTLGAGLVVAGRRRFLAE